MAKDKKAKTAEKKARIAAKQNKKSAQKEKRGKKKGTDDSDAEDIDLESVLADYEKKQEQFLKVTETPCEPPSPRSSATFIGSPSNVKELFLFGGEYYNGALATFYNDLLIYNIDRDDWRKVTSPNSPLPRSGHAWCRGANTGDIYLFGGEFSSPKQGTFYHYNDFWRLEPSTREWSRIEVKGKGPPARSGHRLVPYKNYIIMFGGFQDTSSQTKYLQDLWLYDCSDFFWHNPVLPPATQKPDPRSSFSFHPHEAGAVLFGGYSRIKSHAATGKTKGGQQASKSIMKPTIHQDSWFLRIAQPSSGGPSPVVPVVRWERRKKPANAPNPPRAGATQAYHKGRGISFGGVHDVEESEEDIESEFFDQLFALNLERNRFFPLNLRRSKFGPRKLDERANRRDRAKADEAELLRNLAALETKGSVTASQDESIDADDREDSGTPTKQSKLILSTMPHPRFNAQLAVQGDMLYVFGGTYEHGDREFTFDEMHAIDLGKLDGVREIYRRELDGWLVDEVASGTDSDEDEDSDDEDMGEDNAGVPLPVPVDVIKPAEPTTEPVEVVEEEQLEPVVTDCRPQPRPFESLRDFYARTSAVWQGFLADDQQAKGSVSSQTIKELRKTAFDLAEAKWWDAREEIIAEEERQEEAGIGEIVSIAERSTETGILGRRR